MRLRRIVDWLRSGKPFEATLLILVFDAQVDGEEDTGPAGLLPGLGTMFQPANDWLSDDRRAEYAEWRKRIDKDINSLESRSELTVR